MATELPTVQFNPAGEAMGRWWSKEDDGRILCELCPRACRLKEGDRGFCFVRANRDGKMVLDTYGKSTGFCIDPIEKKPLNHFLPGTAVLSFGTAGCNLGCKFCQNWDISKSREVARLSDQATPEAIATAALQWGCRSVAYTYNDPVIWAEYAIDTAAACQQLGIKSVAVTAGYITPQARGEFYDAMDAANIDLKSFNEDFYYRLTSAHLDPVLDTIRYVCNETDVWVELTNLIIPDANDGNDEFRSMCDWILDNVGADVPVHFTAFHPDFRMMDRPRTSHESLIEAFDIARQTGLRYVYVGNVNDVQRQSTYCPSCGHLLIERDWHQLGRYQLKQNHCQHCDQEIAGVFESQPGTWGRRRQPVRINQVTEQRAPTRKEFKMTTAANDNISEDSFSQADRDAIHKAASQLVVAAVKNTTVDANSLLAELSTRPIAGVYVTLKRGETLRGCCGLQGRPMPLAEALAHSAQRTARDDPRMAPIAESELPFLNLSVSILGSPRPIGVSGDERIDAVQVGKHGLRIRMGNQAGLLLPSVARERNWTSRQFLDAVCRKAGLPPAAWRSDDAVVEIFDGVDFGDALEAPDTAEESGVIEPEQLGLLTDWVRYNLAAIQTGATPFYYANNVDDQSVLGVVLQIQYAADQPPASWMHLVFRDGVPLQSTLFQLTQAAAQALAAQGPAVHWQVRVAVLSTAVQHGLDTDSDLRGVDCGRRAIVARDARRVALAFDRDADPESLLDQALAQQPFRTGATEVYSIVCESESAKLTVSMGPQAQTQITTRPPGVAGMFYPADDVERENTVDELLSDLPAVKQKSVSAAMVPHAGLRYSGRIAADVWRRIKLPETVLIIGPKHTPDGVDWAVAPHDFFQLSATAGLPGDPELAAHLAEAVPGMQLDAAAHRREHGSEVQFPILYRLSSNTKVVAVAMHGGDISELQEAAKALATWLKGLENPPLLVISSDMNHFADDEENRRRDRLALEMLKKNDPAGLLSICAEENISMCGQIPAALVLLTLKELGKKAKYEKIAYATSADVSGDKSRVVGYAGVLF